MDTQKIGRYVYDIEANGLYKEFTKIHCIRAYDLETGVMYRYDEFNEPIFRGIALLNNAKELIGHNIIGFDTPALRKYSKKFTSWKTIKQFDTIIASKLVCTGLDKQDLGRVIAGKMPSNLIGSHSLGSWGYRLDLHKGEYGKREPKETDAEYMERVWEHGCKEMYDYCEQDVLVNVELYKLIQKEIIMRGTPQRALDIEHAFAKIISRQERHGVLFDVPKAEKLEQVLRVESTKALNVLLESYTPKWFVKQPTANQLAWCSIDSEYAHEIVKTMKRSVVEYDAKGRIIKKEKKNKRKGKEVAVYKSETWFTHGTTSQYLVIDGMLHHKCKIANASRKKKVQVPTKLRDSEGCVVLDDSGIELWTTKEINTTNLLEGSYYSEVIIKEFNPNSSAHVIRWLKDLYDWSPTEFTEAGNPKTDGDTLGALTFEGIDVLQKYQMLLKRLSQLSDGKSALLSKYVKSTNRIHGRCDTLGAVTRRCTHSSPNLAQIPANRAPYGENFRELFIAPKGYKIVGADGSGLELRTLAHYLYWYDEGLYRDVVLDGDIHSKNQLDAGLPTRDDAKTFIYAFLYGAGNEKLGEIVCPNGTAQEKNSVGGSLKKKFMEANPPIKNLIEEIKERASTRRFVYDLDGNKLFIRSEHSAPNLLLQSCGAIVMKYWAVEVDRVLQENGLENSDDVIHTDRTYDYENVLNIHDEAQLEVKDDCAKLVGSLMQEAFPIIGSELEMNIKIEGEAKIGSSWKETH